MKFMRILALILFVFTFHESVLGEFTYKKLMVKDYEELREILKKQVKNSQKQSFLDSEKPLGAIGELKKGLSWLFMRPDADGLRKSLLPILENEIINYKPFLDTLHEITKDSIFVLKSKKSSTIQKTSHLFVLENTIEHIKNSESNSALKILKTIKDAKIKLPKKVREHKAREFGKETKQSPSQTAKKLIKIKAKKKEAEEEKVKKKKPSFFEKLKLKLKI